MHQGWIRPCYSKADGESAESCNVIKMSQAGDSGATGQTGSHNRSDRSCSVQTPEPNSQTGGSDRSNADWPQQRIEHYRARTNDMCEAIKESEDMDKLGQGFTSADPLEKVDLGDGTIPRPTFVNKNLSVEYKADLVIKRIHRLFCLGIF